MKSVTVVCFLAVLAVAAAGQQDKYTDRYDDINVKQILGNRRLLIAYLACCLDKGKCTSEGRELKSHIKDALENECAKCTEVQRRWTKEVITHLINKEPAYWDQLVAKYDPQRKFTNKYEKELRAIKVHN